jgi:hypothetical protein
MFCESCNYMATTKQRMEVHLVSKKHLDSGVVKTKELFFCEKCNYTTYVKGNYNIHCLSDLHLGIEKVKKTHQEYTCEQCHFTTFFKHVLDNHLLSKKHLHFNDEKQLYTCIPCDVTTNNKLKYDMHCCSKKHEVMHSTIKSYNTEINLGGLTQKIREEEDVVLFLCKKFILGRKCIKLDYVFTDKWIKNESIIADLYDRIRIAYIKASSQEQVENMKCTYNFDELHSLIL